MKSREEFKTQDAYVQYLRTYISIQNMSSLLIIENSSDLQDYEDAEEKEVLGNLANISVACANALLGALNISNDVKEPKEVLGPLNQNKEVIRKNLKKGQIKTLLIYANDYFKIKEYAKALTYFKNALELEPDNKQAKEGLKKCEQWMKAISDLHTLEEERPFKAVPIKEESKEEFTTDFPKLE